jgi:hypothetical protein
MISKQRCPESAALPNIATTVVVVSSFAFLREVSLPPKLFSSPSLSSKQAAKTHLLSTKNTAIMANYLASIFGTEQDKGV